MKYVNYSVEDFAADDFFIQWVIENDATAAAFWAEFKIKNPHKAHTIDNARVLLLNLRSAETSEDNSEALSRMWSNIEREAPADDTIELKPWYAMVPLRIAAAVVIIAGGAWLLDVARFFETDTDTKQTAQVSEGFTEEVNTTGGIIKVHLSDGSTVSLENNSRLKYKLDYASGAERKVYLTGEGYFEVAKDPHKPFLVYTTEVVTKVLGTSFRVKAFTDSKDIKVSVAEGKVSVFSVKSLDEKNESKGTSVNGLILTPNQEAIYNRREDSFEKTLVESPKVMDIDVQRTVFKFHNESLPNVFRTLEKVYGVEIIFDNDVMQNCSLTAPLGNESLYEKLNIICKTVGATYELIDAKIVISGSGCGKGTQ